MVGWSSDNESEADFNVVDCKFVSRDCTFRPLDGSIGHAKFDVQWEHFWVAPLAPTFITNDVYSCPGIDDNIALGIVDTNRELETIYI